MVLFSPSKSQRGVGWGGGRGGGEARVISDVGSEQPVKRTQKKLYTIVFTLKEPTANCPW